MDEQLFPTPTEQEPDEEFTALNRECWRLLRDIVYNGTVVLKGGTPVALKPEALFDVIMRLAQMKPPKTRKAPGVIDFKPGVTYHAEEKSTGPVDPGNVEGVER